MQKVDRRPLLPGLTALRFFAATYVLLFHLFPVSADQARHPTVAQRVLGAGFTGVSCFFVLSGFILAYTHPTVPDKAKFFRARFARVYPLYLFAMLLALPALLRAALVYGPRSQLWVIAPDSLLLQAWIPSIALALNAPAWTLSCEAFFYAVFPFVIGRAWVRGRRPFLTIGLLWFLQVLPPVLAHLWLLPWKPTLGPVAFGLLFTPLFRVGEFLAGVVLGIAFSTRQQTAPFGAERTPAWLLPAALLVCAVTLCLNFAVPHEVVRNGLLLGPFCLLIWALASSPSRVLASRPLQIGGEISYGVYLLQVPLDHWLYAASSRLPGGGMRSPFWLCLVYPFAWLTYVAVEKPCRRWLLGRVQATSKPIPTPQPELP